VSVASEFEHAVQVLDDALPSCTGWRRDLDEQDVRGAARELLEHRRRELSSVSVALAAQLLGVSRTTVEAWKTEGVLVSAQQRPRHEVTMDDDLGELGGVLTAPARSRSMDDQELRDWGQSPRSGHTTRRERLPSTGERASSTKMIIDNIAAYAVGRSHNIVGLPIGKSRVEADPQVVIGQREPDAVGAALPNSHQPNAVGPKIGNLIPVAVGNVPQDQ
jgi:hypothetical protein